MISVTDAKIDLLTAALKAFERGRTKAGPEGFADWDAWSLATRATFAIADGNLFAKKTFDYDDFMRQHVGPQYKGHTLDEKRAVGAFLSHERKQPHDFGWYLNAKNRPQAAGMTPAVLLSLMSKLRPAEFPAYSQQIRDAFVFLALVRTPLPRLSLKAYEAEKALQDAVLARMFQLGIGQVAGDRTDPADYLTLLEFAAWLSLDASKTAAKNLMMKGAAPLPPALKGGIGALVFR